MNNLFAYGTLMCEDIFHRVTGIKCQYEKGTLQEYRRHPVRGQTYPGIIPKRGHVVPGTIYFDIPRQAWKSLDRFEGEMYTRVAVMIMRENLAAEKAYTYVMRHNYVHCLEEHDWDFQQFLSEGKRIFQTHYTGFDDIQMK